MHIDEPYDITPEQLDAMLDAMIPSEDRPRFDAAVERGLGHLRLSNGGRITFFSTPEHGSVKGSPFSRWWDLYGGDDAL